VNVSNSTSKFGIRSRLLGVGPICGTSYKYPAYLVIVRVAGYKTQVLGGVVSMAHCVCSGNPRHQCRLVILLFSQLVFIPTICILWESVLSLSLMVSHSNAKFPANCI
jgi:hypothetical protein